MIGKDFNSLIDLVKAFPTEQSCIDHLTELRRNGYVVSPFNPTSKVYKCKGNKYRCKNTGKYFNVRTNTLFDNTKIELIKWFMAIWLVTGHKKGISSLQLSRDINVTQKTAWFMLQRIRKCFGCENDHDLNNEVEIDETFVGGKNKNRYADMKVPHNTGRAHIDKMPVWGMVERTLVEHITPEVVRNAKDVMVYTDEWVGYKQVNRIYNHLFVKHGEDECVNGRIYTNTIEGFWSILKRGIVGIYHFTSCKHIQRYVDEFLFRSTPASIPRWNALTCFCETPSIT